MKISQLMSPNLVVASPADSLKFAAQIMEKNDYDALPICDNNRLIGMLTVKDIVTKAISRGLSLEGTNVFDCMTFEAKYVFADQSTDEVINFMIEQQLRRLLVLGVDYQLLGIVCLDDLAVAEKVKNILSVSSQSADQYDAYRWPSPTASPRIEESQQELTLA